MSVVAVALLAASIATVAAVMIATGLGSQLPPYALIVLFGGLAEVALTGWASSSKLRKLAKLTALGVFAAALTHSGGPSIIPIPESLVLGLGAFLAFPFALAAATRALVGTFDTKYLGGAKAYYLLAGLGVVILMMVIANEYAPTDFSILFSLWATVGLLALLAGVYLTWTHGWDSNRPNWFQPARSSVLLAVVGSGILGLLI